MKEKICKCGHLRVSHIPNSKPRLCWFWFDDKREFCKCSKFEEEYKLIRLIKNINEKRNL